MYSPFTLFYSVYYVILNLLFYNLLWVMERFNVSDVKLVMISILFYYIIFYIT